MKNNLLRAPLIKSAILLAAFSLIIYLTISSPEGSVWTSLTAIIYAVFKAAQLGVGLILALALCFAVLGGIFFASVAMISTDSARKMYNDLQEFTIDKINSVKSMVGKSELLVGKTISSELAASLRSDMAELEVSMKNLGQVQGSIEERSDTLQSRIELIEQDEAVTELSGRLQAEDEKTKKVQASLEQFDRQLQQMKEQVDDLGQKIQNVPSADALQEITGRADDLENKNMDFLSAVNALQDKMDVLSTELQAVRSDPVESDKKQLIDVSEQGDNAEHRLFTYVESSEEKTKVIQLVEDTLTEEMTYAQVIDHVSGNVTKKTARVLAEHPSLTKEYIREVRKRG